MDEQTHREIAKQHVVQAGSHLRRWLDEEPRNIDNLDEFEIALVRRVCGNSVLDRTMNRASQLDKIEREAERAARDKSQIKRVAFEMEEYVAVDLSVAEIKTREFTR